MARLRISLTSLFVLTAIAALVVALCFSRFEVSRLNQENAELNSELNTNLPIRSLEIKAQIEQQTAAAKMPVTVISSGYTGSAYLVGFSYFDPQTGVSKSSSFTLRYNQKGRFVGSIRDAPFLQSQADEDGERGLLQLLHSPCSSTSGGNTSKLASSETASA